MPCPLCLIGLPQPHSEEDWARLDTDPEFKERVVEALETWNTQTFKENLSIGRWDK